MKQSMSGRKQMVAVTLLILGLTLSASSWGLDAEEVLTAFRDSYGWLDSAAMHLEMYEDITPSQKRSSKSDQPEYGSETSVDFYIDQVKGWHIIETFQLVDRATRKAARFDFGEVSAWSLEKGYFKEAGNLAFRFDTDVDGKPFIYLDTKLDGNLAGYASIGAPAAVTGHSFFFSREKLPELLDADTVAISETELDGQASCLVEAQTDYGHVALWLSPEENYRLQKAVLSKEAGKDLSCNGERIPKKDYEDAAASYLIREIRVLKTMPLGGYFIPLEIETRRYTQRGDERDSEWKSSVTVSDVALNPDFAALKAFNLQVPDDCHISILNHSDMPDYSAGWKGGKPVFKLEDQELQEQGQAFLGSITVIRTSLFTKINRWLTLKKKDGDEAFYYLKNALVLNLQTVALLLAAGFGFSWLVWRIVVRLIKGSGKKACKAHS